MRIKFKLMGHQTDNAAAKVFFALWPTATESRLLAAWQAPLKLLCGGRAMRTGTLHSTLVFIGNVRLSDLVALQSVAREVKGERFELCFDAPHYWGHNRIVYAAPTYPPRQLKQLVDALEQKLAGQGFIFDNRVYRPHVTLLRNAHRTDVSFPRLQSVCWQIDDFALLQSTPQGGLVGYRVLARFPLGNT